MGDVSGRGPDEAALGAGLRIAWRALTLAGADAGDALSTLELMIENGLSRASSCPRSGQCCCTPTA